MKINYYHPTFIQYKKIPINWFPLYSMKKREKKKNLKSKENKIENILKKNIKGK